MPPPGAPAPARPGRLLFQRPLTVAAHHLQGADTGLPIFLVGVLLVRVLLWVVYDTGPLSTTTAVGLTGSASREGGLGSKACWRVGELGTEHGSQATAGECSPGQGGHSPPFKSG